MSHPGPEEVRTTVLGDVTEILFGGTFLTSRLAQGLATAFSGLEEGTRAVVLSNHGRAFAAGADLAPLRTGDVEDGIRFNQELVELSHLVARSPVPVICCLNGMAFGGGLELALACTMRIAASSAVMGFPEVKVGLVPGSGGLLRLPRVVSPGVAADLVLTGRTVSADEALRLGLVDEVVDGEPLTRGHEIAAAIAANAPVAVRAALDVLRTDLDDDATTTLVEVHLRKLLGTDDAREGFAAFAERRTPYFLGL